MDTIPVVFVYADWIALFPELSGISSASATQYFMLAEEFVVNNGCGPVRSPPLLKYLLYLTTAHLAYLLSTRTNGIPTTGGTEPAPPIVGRINTATEGSVSIGSEFPNQSEAAAWWNQTQYGATAWKLLAPFRTMRYVVSPRRIYNPPYLPGWRGRSGWWS